MKSIKVTFTFLIAMVCIGSFGSIDMKKQYQELKINTEKKVRVIDRKLDKFQVKISKMTGEAKEDMEKSYDKLISLKKDLMTKVASASDISQDKWEVAKDKIEDVADRLESQIDEAID